MNIASIILPNQLFENNILLLNLSKTIYLVEDSTYFTKYSFHKMKLIMHRASMKFYYDYLNTIDKANKKIIYLNHDKFDYDTIFSKHNIIHIYDPIDHNLMKKFNKLSSKYNVLLNTYDNPLFIETKDELQSYYDSLKSHTNYIHDNGFYKWQRIRLNILVDKNDKPLFGKLSFDHDNRKTFDDKYKKEIPKEPSLITDIDSNTISYLSEAKKYVEKNWPDNFGETEHYIYPVNFLSAKILVKQFIKFKLKTFGKYEDATDSEINFGSHSVLSSSLNIGLISIKYVLEKIIKTFNKLNLEQKKKMIPNVEGFIRQLIGWRSYVRFIYVFHGKEMIESNQFNHQNKISQNWFNSTTGIYPIDSIITKVNKIAYAHHIERLMYLGNFALISKINPKEIYDWFMICFIDSYEWVMVPNIMGMSQYSSDNIKMMTRPYFSSSNYIKNMSNFKLNKYDKINIGSKSYYWNEIWDALYYNFIKDNKNILKKIYSTAYAVAHWDKKSQSEQKELIKIAKDYLNSY
jgi:deoxyribodipyrimidine photolyase-related protein